MVVSVNTVNETLGLGVKGKIKVKKKAGANEKAQHIKNINT